jgi:hypothetical protein
VGGANDWCAYTKTGSQVSTLNTSALTGQRFFAEVVGPIAEGVQVHFYVTAGEVSGPKMRGRLRIVGGDWLLLRTDGIGVFDVRATLELDNGL